MGLVFSYVQHTALSLLPASAIFTETMHTFSGECREICYCWRLAVNDWWKRSYTAIFVIYLCWAWNRISKLVTYFVFWFIAIISFNMMIFAVYLVIVKRILRWHQMLVIIDFWVDYYIFIEYIISRSLVWWYGGWKGGGDTTLIVSLFKSIFTFIG